MAALWIAFRLARRPANSRYTYGYGRAEDLAGLFVIAMIALSAVVAGWEAVDRLLHPAPVRNLFGVGLAGVIGFLGNEAVAVFRIREGRAIGSAALVADGHHARIDGSRPWRSWSAPPASPSGGTEPTPRSASSSRWRSCSSCGPPRGTCCSG